MVLSTAYLPPVQWFQQLLAGARIEAHESYEKQTIRNRCTIDSPNGPLSLTIPVERPAGGSRLIRDIRISDHGNWRHQHWQALVSSYDKSPFFDYLQDDFRPFYERRWTYLFDFNEALIELCLGLIEAESHIEYTQTFEGADALPAPAPSTYKEYYQVFSSRHGFLPNLSIVDLIFNMGKEALLVLKDS